jgi:hypothetical protein
MDNMKRIITGIAFTAVLALGLIANGGDAYAKSKSGGGNTSVFGDITITITVDPSSNELLPLGITWE